MGEKICRWGILGTALIAQKNWQSIRNASNATLSAVASRDAARASDFISRCQSTVPFDPRPAACGSYEELLARDDVDAVYLPLPTGIRKESVIRAAESGKHVMCEKPCAVHVQDLQEMVDACREHNVQFMDGVMFMHSHRLKQMREALDDGRSVGHIRRIATQFSFCAPDDWLATNIRTSSHLEPAGCLGDLGWYSIRFALWAMNWQMPQRVRGRLLRQLGGSDSSTPVPTDFSGELFFPGGESASFYCSFVTQHQQWAHISGTSGYLYVPDFVLPFYGSETSFEVANHIFQVHGCDFNMEQHTRRITAHEYSNSAQNAQETLMFRRFSELVAAGEPDPFWPRIALQTQQVLNACLEGEEKELNVSDVQ